MALDGLRFCAKYPFTNEAKQYLDFLKMDLEKIDDTVIEYSANRVASALGNLSQYSRDKLEQIKFSKEPYLVNEIISYPISKILVSLGEARPLRKKFAKAEAQKTYLFLQFESVDTIYNIAKQFFNIAKEDSSFLVPFQEYLMAPPEESGYSLVNLELEKGKVRLDKEKLAKLVSQYVYHSVMSTKIDKRDLKNKMFAYFAEELKKDSRYAIPEDLGKVELEAFPPCMRQIYSELQAEDKVGHMPRFVFSTFLAGIKMPIDEAIGLFKNQPNFNDKKTRYYLEHSYGLKSNRTKYSVPSCSKMDSYGVCRKDKTCLWSHPMTYYARTKRSKK